MIEGHVIVSYIKHTFQTQDEIEHMLFSNCWEMETEESLRAILGNFKEHYRYACPDLVKELNKYEQMDQSELNGILESMLSQRKSFPLMLDMRDSWDLKFFFIQSLLTQNLPSLSQKL